MFKLSKSLHSCVRLVSRRHVSTKSTLQIMFDTQRESKPIFSLDNAGLFGLPELKDSTGFYLLQQQVFHEVDTLVEEATSRNRSRKLVQIFDQLSDSLCRVADLAEFVRLAHPQRDYSSAAEETCMKIGALVEKLNTNTRLYESLKEVVQSGDKFEEDDVDKRVAELFLFDFEQSGIHLEETKRNRFVDINEKIMFTGNHFVLNASRPVRVPRNKIPPALNMWFTVEGDHVSVTGSFADSQTEMVREHAYKLYMYEDPQQKQHLDNLFLGRFMLAQLVGFDTYAHRALRGTMAESPENVRDFLNILSERVRPKAEENFKELQKLKRSHGGNGDLMQWDFPFYSGLARQLKLDVSSTDLAAYFTLGNCMEGLSSIFSSLFGVKLEYQQVRKGELWHSDVQKLAVVHESEGTLGYIYCDFFERLNKVQQDSHFTIRGGREKEDGSYQLPEVVLHLNLPVPPTSKPCLLTPGMVENLFHEFGHAMHSMLGRTRYQHVTGTRCPTDFAEIPSVLMEYFFHDPRVISQIARHYVTKQPLPAELINVLCNSKKTMAAADLQQQVFYSMLDQVYHGPMPLEGSTTDVLANVQKEYFSLPHVPNTASQLRFGHFVGYGAKYYSYLMSRAVASQIWHQCFKKDPFSRSMGEKYRNEVLAHGGGKPPAELVEGMLGEKPTTDMLVNSLMEDITES